MLAILYVAERGDGNRIRLLQVEVGDSLSQNVDLDVWWKSVMMTDAVLVVKLLLAVHIQIVLDQNLLSSSLAIASCSCLIGLLQ